MEADILANSRKTILVIGLGRFGVSLCEKLVEMKQYVIGIDRHPGVVKEMADVIDVCAQMDATDEDSLIKIGAKDADIAVVTIGENIEASIMATTILKGFDISHLVSRAQTPLHARILAKVGANRVIFPEKEMGVRVAEQIINPWLNSFSQLPGMESLIGEISPMAEMTGKTLSEMGFRNRYKVLVLLVAKNGRYILPGADTIINAEDKLLVAGQKEALGRLVEEEEK